MSQCIGYLWSLTIAFRGRSATSAAGTFMKEGGKGESSRKPNDKDSGGKRSNKAGRGPEGEVDKGKGEEIEQAGGVDDGEGEGDQGAENEVRAPQKLTAAHDYRHGVTDALLVQLCHWRPEAIRKCKGGMMPYKHFPMFALDNHIRLFGWPVERVLHFPGNPLFDVDKMVKREWEHLWQVGIVKQDMGIETWSAGMSEFYLYSEIADIDYTLEELEMTSEGGEYGAIPLVTDLHGNTLFSVDQCRAAHLERDSKPKVRQGASATRQEPGDQGKTFQGHRILELEERPQGGRELYQMEEEDEGFCEVALDFEGDERMLVDEHDGEEVVYKCGGEEVVYGHGGKEAVYEYVEEEAAYGHGGGMGGYNNDYDMEPRPRYNPGYRRRIPPARAPEFFETLPTLALSARGLQGASGMYHAAAPPQAPHNHTAVDPQRRSHEPPARAPSFPREAQHIEHPRICSSSRDFPTMRQGTPAGQVQGQSNAQAGPSWSAIPPAQLPSRPVEKRAYSQSQSFLRLAQSLCQEQKEGVTYYKQDMAAGPSSDAYSIAQEAKAHRCRYAS